MDSDLSLIEIAGEDDSLLQPILAAGDGVPSLGAANRNTTADYFFCSPLHDPRSNFKPPEGASTNKGFEEEAKRLFCSDSASKENVNVEKAEALKLCIEPQQMKRKKKGVGYNLRKSLAWDRAFFTEEGVLDAAELSMISGSSSKSNRQTLSSIEEESASNLSNLQAFESVKESARTNTKKTKLNSGSSLIPKTSDKEAPFSMAPRRVLSTHDVNRSGLKRSACPRPMASTLHKRPSNLVPTKTTVKETKVSKLPVQKPSPLAPAPSRTIKNSTPSTSVSKRSQIAQPVVYPQKNCRVSGSLDKSRSVANSSKVSLAGKSTTTKTSLGQAKRNVASSAKSGPKSLATEAKDLGVISNLPRPSTDFPPNISDSESGKTTTFLPQTFQEVQIQTGIPTGLRMPSPSLGFFGQSKATPVQSPLKLTSQCGNVTESNIPNPRKLGFSTPGFAPKPPLPPRSVPEKTNHDTRTGVSKASSSSYGCSNVPSVKPASSDKLESNSLLTSMLNVEQKSVMSKKGHDDTQNQNQLEGGLVNLQRNVDCEEIPHLTLDFSSAMEATGPSKSDITNNELAEDKPHHLPMKHDSSELTSGNLCVNKPNLTEQADVVNVSTFEADLFAGSQMLPEIVTDVRFTDEVEINAFARLASSTEQEKDYPCASKLCAEDTEVQSLDDNFRVENSNSTINGSVTVNIQPQVIVSDEVTLHKDDWSLGETSFLSEEAEHEYVLTEEVKMENVLTENSKQEYVMIEEAKLENVLTEDAKEEYVLTEEEKLEYVLTKDAKPEYGMIDDAKNEDIMIEEARKEDVLTEDAMQDYVLGLEEQLLNILTEEAQLGNVLTEDAKQEYVLMEEAKMVNIQTEDAKQECSLIEEAKQGNILAEDAKQENSLTEEAKLENALTEESKKENVLTDDAMLDYVLTDEREGTVASESEVERSTDPSPIPLILLDCEVNMAELVECRNQEDCPADENDIHYETPIAELGNTEDHQTDMVASEFVNVIGQEISGIASLQSSQPCRSSINDIGESVKLDSPMALDHFLPDQEDSVMEKVQDSIAEEDEDKLTMACVDEIEIISCDEKQSSKANGLLFEKTCSFEDLQNLEKENIVTSSDFGYDKVFEQVKCGDENVDFRFPVNQPREDASDDFAVGDPSQPLQVDQNAESFGQENDNNPEPEIPLVEQFPRNHEIQHNNLSFEADSRSKQSDDIVSGKSTPDRESKEATRDCKKSGIEKKQDNLVIKPPVNAAPFSDEWLAAVEAAGEEILTMKGGAVQNSPQDRSQPEPSPWSPVKRKYNQALGPFDCTKHTNH